MNELTSPQQSSLARPEGQLDVSFLFLKQPSFPNDPLTVEIPNDC